MDDTARATVTQQIVPYVIGSALAVIAIESITGYRSAVLLAGGLIVLGGVVFTPVGLAVSRIIDAVNSRVGALLSWLILVAVIISAGNATIRKLFDTSSNAWLELQWVLFGIVFLLCAPWTLLANEHIRIDIVNSMLPLRVRRKIEVVGHLVFLLPFTVVMMITGYPFFWASFRILEKSLNAGGLPQWPAKFLVPLGFTLLFFQAISELTKRLAMNRGEIPDPLLGGGGHHAAAEAEAERLLAIAKAEAEQR